MDWLADIFRRAATPPQPARDESYYALWLAERRAAEDANRALMPHLPPEYYAALEFTYKLPGGRTGSLTIHRCGPARLQRELKARGMTTAGGGIYGDVYGGWVHVFHLCGMIEKTGRYASAQRDAGHEFMTHVCDQIDAIWAVWEAGGSEADMKAAAAAHLLDADRQGEGI